jgi:hypothetical protein
VNYWILQFNPKVYYGKPNYPSEVPDCLDYWCIKNHSKHVKKDDRFFIWYCGKDRGIHNIGKIISVEPHSETVQKYLDLMWASDINNRKYDSEAQTRLAKYPKILIEKEHRENFQHFFPEDELKEAGFNFRISQGGIFSKDYDIGELLWQYIHKSKRGK